MCVCVCVCVCVYLPSPLQRGCNTKSIFKESLTGLNSEFSLSYTGCHTKVKEPSLPFYLLIIGGKIADCILFLRY